MGDNHIRNTQLNYDRAMYVDELEYKGHISTFSNHTVYTDSAAAASALATGRKYNNYEVTHHDGVDIASITEQAKAAGGPSGPKRAAKSVGRNEPCPCGSGKKYKDCCGKN